MANIIDYTYFVDELNIPINGVNEQTYITNAITRYETEFLRDILGYELHKAFITGLADPSPASKWTDLRDGKEFTFSYSGVSQTVKWHGLKGESKVKSPIAMYVYCRYRLQRESYFSGMGQAKSESENSVSVNFGRAVCDIWNEMVDIIGKVSDGFNTYEVPDIDSYINEKGCLYNFLCKNLTDYSTWKYSDPKYYINPYGI